MMNERHDQCTCEEWIGRGFRFGLILLLIVFAGTILVFADGDKPAQFKHIEVQYIVALGDPQATSGVGAETWGLWRQDPGPRGCLLENYAQLKKTGIATAQWRFDPNDWWLEEHGAIMEKPEFPLPAGKYVVTGGREVTSILTVFPPDEKGVARWELADAAKLYDVTHLPCHAARYTPKDDQGDCLPEKAGSASYPVPPGVAMPEVDGCRKQDYAVLFVIGVENRS